ncbi:helix-turn-helix transcriptional regulator [Methylobacterium sp. W2]|uniref:helix-turn-helix domain-containing protein n=1 Tax=Methylobacterium sp. W2 TaxID=2598107 RepID=UPI001D0CAD67|nr:helix-turn-helix transcriptional regulator [Methylobacterium sp. W2]MCC0807549.1 helix-turn-helix transcriptional regulator [Methylobacterium sp. W2]
MNTKSATDVDRTVGLRITTLRKAKGLSQTELGQAIGVTFQQVQKYEKGANRVSGGRLQQVAQVLEVPVSALFGESEPEGQSEVFGFLAETGAVEILRAYVAIDNEQLRRDVLQLVRTAAKIGAGPVEGNA